MAGQDYPRGQRPEIVIYDDPPYLPFHLKTPTTMTQDQDTDPNAVVQHSGILGMPVTAEQMAELDKTGKQQAEQRFFNLTEIAAKAMEYLPPGETTVSMAMAVLRKAMKDDPGYAWSWHCNLAMPIHDSGVSHRTANLAAARLMMHIFDVDTMTQVMSEQDAARPEEG